MSCKKFFSKALLGLLAFNLLNGVVPTFAMECKDDDEETNTLFYESWCWDYSFDKNVNKKYDKFMSLLESHNQLFKDCGIELKKDIKEIYKELFKAAYNDISLNSFAVFSSSELNEPLIPCNILMKNTDKVFSGIEVDLYGRDERGVRVSSYKYKCPCVYKNEKGVLVFTIKFAQTILYSVDLDFVSYEED